MSPREFGALKAIWDAAHPKEKPKAETKPQDTATKQLFLRSMLEAAAGARNLPPADFDAGNWRDA